MPKDQCSSTLL